MVYDSSPRAYDRGGPKAPTMNGVPGGSYRGPASAYSGFNPGDSGDVRTPQQWGADLARLGAAPAPQLAGSSAAGGADPYADYISQFNASYANSNSQIDAGLRQALGELDKRRQGAADVVASLPAQLQGTYGFAQQNMANAGAQGLGALSQDVQRSAKAYDAPYANALKADQAAAQGLTPFLNLGVLANAQSGTAMLNQQAMAGRLDLEQQKRAFEMNMAEKRADRKQSEDDFYAHTKYAHDLDAGDRQAAALIGEQTHARDRGEQVEDRDFGASAQLAEANTRNNAAIGAQRDEEARKNGFQSDADYQQVRNSGDLQVAKQQIDSGKSIHGHKASKEAVVKGLLKASRGRELVRELVRQGYIKAEDADKWTS